MGLKHLVPYNCSVIEQSTTDGRLYLTVVEDEAGKPIRITAEIGKAGSSLRAWTDAFSRIACIVLEKGGTIEDVMDELSNITTDRTVFDGKQKKIRSGPEGIVAAIQKYKTARSEAFKESDSKHGVLYNR